MQEQLTSYDRNLKNGITYVILSFFLTISPYFILITSIGYFLGIYRIWKSQTKLTKKLFWTIIPILFLPLYLLLIPALQKLNHELFHQRFEIVINEDFTGKAIILFDIECGQSKQIRNGREVIIIPENGIALCKTKRNKCKIAADIIINYQNNDGQLLPKKPTCDLYNKNINRSICGGDGRINIEIRDSSIIKSYLSCIVCDTSQIRTTGISNKKTEITMILSKLPNCN